VGGGLGWFYYPYHKNINKTLILQDSCDNYWKELQMGDKFCEEVEAIHNNAMIGKILTNVHQKEVSGTH
jgi:hypothetical protein